MTREIKKGISGDRKVHLNLCILFRIEMMIYYDDSNGGYLSTISFYLLAIYQPFASPLYDIVIAQFSKISLFHIDKS